MDLTNVDWQQTRYPGMAIHFYRSGRRELADAAAGVPGRVVALIRMAPGTGYPRHKHRGAEDVLVLRGAYADELGVHRAGDFITYADGTTHTPVAVDGESEEDCILLSVAHEGIQLER